jgi:hypothetical protein
MPSRLLIRWLRSGARNWLLRAVLAVLLLGIANFWGISSPNAFPKCCSIVKTETLPQVTPGEAGRALDVRRLLARIPYERSLAAPSSWIIHPDRRVEFVMETGGGDCATKSRALARILQASNIPYSLVFVMDAAEAETGAGHAVVECPIDVDGIRGVGIVDMLNASVVTVDGRPMTVGDLLPHAPVDVEFVRANENCRVDARYYGEYLRNTVVGVSRGEELNRYFDFIAGIHVALGSEGLEKVVFIAGALVLGIYPAVYMTSGDIARLDGWLQFEVVLAHAVIWAVRALGLLVVIEVIAQLAEWRQKRARPVQEAGRAT